MKFSPLAIFHACHFRCLSFSTYSFSTHVIFDAIVERHLEKRWRHGMTSQFCDLYFWSNRIWVGQFVLRLTVMVDNYMFYLTRFQKVTLSNLSRCSFGSHVVDSFHFPTLNEVTAHSPHTPMRETDFFSRLFGFKRLIKLALVMQTRGRAFRNRHIFCFQFIDDDEKWFVFAIHLRPKCNSIDSPRFIAKTHRSLKHKVWTSRMNE